MKRLLAIAIFTVARTAAAQSFAVATEQSAVLFEARTTFHDFTGHSEHVSGTLSVEAGRPVRAEIELPIVSLKTDEPARDERMRSAEYFDSAKFQNISFIFSSFDGPPLSTQGQATQGQATQGQATQGQATQGQATQGQATQGQAAQGQAAQGQVKGTLHGTLKIKDTAIDVAVPVVCEVNGRRLEVSGEFPLDIRRARLTPPVVFVVQRMSETVRIKFHLVFLSGS